MTQRILVACLLYSLQVYAQSTCKEPHVEKRLMADDVRYASPFYVIAMPRNLQTVYIDNICYSYFDQLDKFFHIMSVTYQNGSNTYYTFSKGDLTDRIGLAIGSGVLDSQCVYHDYTLTPVCNSTVFILYRCFIDGDCNKNIDIGKTPGVDVRIVLAANPIISEECRKETQTALQDTTTLDGGDYVFLTQKLSPQCITRYNNTVSIGETRAVGTKQVTDNELAERFGAVADEVTIQTNTVAQPAIGGNKLTLNTNVGAQVRPTAPETPNKQFVSTNTVSHSYMTPGYAASPWPTYNVPTVPKNVYNPYGSTVKTTGARPGTKHFMCL